MVIKVECTVKGKENTVKTVVSSTALPSPPCPYTLPDTKQPRKSHFSLNFRNHLRYFNFKEITNEVIHHLKAFLQRLKNPSA
jgi:hypothetical protein